MYLNKNQIKAIDIAIESLEMCCRNGLQEEESGFAIDILNKMLSDGRKNKKQRQRIGGVVIDKT